MYSVTCLWPLTSRVTALSSSGVCEAHPPSPQGAWVRVDLQPGAARRAGRSQRSAAGGARSEAAGHLGHLPELQPQGCQVGVTPGVNILLYLLTKGFSVQEQNKVHKRIKWVIIVCWGSRHPRRSGWRSIRARWTTSDSPATLKVHFTLHPKT